MTARTARLTLIVIVSVTALAAAGPAAAATTGAGHWTWQSPLPSGSWIVDTSFVSAAEGWAVARTDDVLHTTDGGATWANQPTGENDSLYGVGFVSATEGWAVGEWGCVLHTTDGGVTWERQTSGTLDTLIGVDCIDAGHAWAVGTATALATTDGGATWAVRLGGGGSVSWWGWYGFEKFYTEAEFKDEQHGCVVGGRWLHGQAEDSTGAVWSTSDGGSTWTETDVPGTTELLGLTSQGGTYWACGAGNLLAHSVDGVNWTRDTASAPVYLYDVAVTAGGQGWAVGSGETNDWFSYSDITVGIVLHTTDGGVSWQPVAVPVLGGDGLVSVSCDDLGNGRIVGQSGSIYVTADGGDTWAAVGPKRDESITFTAVTQAPDGDLWVVGQAGGEYGGDGEGVVWRSSDDGATWDAIDDPLIAVAGLNVVCAADGGEAWVAGVGGRILHTTDAGVTWEQQPTGVGASLVGLAFSDAEHGWAVSAGLVGAVLKTDDGGAHWALTTIGTRERYLSVEASGSDVWLGGMEYRSDCMEEGAGLIAHSADGGATWSSMPVGPRAVLALTFPSATTGWALSGQPYWWDSAGSLMHTADGGATWAAVKPGPPGLLYGFRAMEFADAGEGWLLAETGYGTLLLHTIDGGTHWGAVAMNETWSLRSMHFSGHARGWLVGGADTILATTDGGGMAPMSTSNIRQSVKWTNKAFTVRFTTLDDGYGLAPTQSRLGDGPWEEAASRLFVAPSNHSNDGYHLVRYRGVDLAGNREAARIALVVVDTRRPSFDARSRVTVRQMRNASLRLKSADKLSATVRVRGVVSTLQGRQVDTIRASLRADGVWHSVRYFCTLKAGTYRVVISVRDRAGNSSARSQTMTLVVRGR